MVKRMTVVTTVSPQLNGLEKRFSFTHSHVESFGVTGGAVFDTGVAADGCPLAAVDETLELSSSVIYRSTNFMRTLNQLTITEMVKEQLR